MFSFEGANLRKRANRPEERLASAESAQDPPVPMPNTEVKLSSAENTWMETSREDRKVLAFLFKYSPLAQSVERRGVNL